MKQHSKTEEGKKLAGLVEKKKNKLTEANAVKHKANIGIKSYFKPANIPKAEKERINEALVEFSIAINESFLTVEDPFFKQMAFKLNPGYIMMSSRELQRKVDVKIEKIKTELAKETQEDFKSHKSGT